MYIIFKRIKVLLFTLLTLFLNLQMVSQSETNEWKMQIAFGFNKPLASQQNEGFSTKNVNFPTINLGVQHMFNNKLGT